MSFKREGDDKDQLDLLRQRRIRDLLGESIPKDEAKLLSNGKFTCMVCFHRPIFDTIDMVIVHRAGKKHEKGAQIFEEKQRELKNLIEVRKTEHYEKYGNTNIKIAAEHLHNRHLMTSTPYDARTKKIKPYDRKPKIHVASKSDARPATDTTKLSELPGTKGRWGHLQSSEPIMHDAQLKNIFRKPEDKFEEVKPYIRKQQQVNIVQSSYSLESGNNSMSNLMGSRQKYEGNHISCHVSEIITNLANNAPVPPPSSEHNRTSKPDVPKILTEEEKQYAGKVSQLRGAGWMKDWDGKWIKDEFAEFDSDEEPPDL